MAPVIAPGGDVDIAAVAALFADRTRARVLVALSDGRALPASVLASEAGVTPQAASAQLSRLQAAGLLAVEQSGRHRYYRLAAGGQVTAILEALAQLAPAQPIRSLRQSTRAAALRSARACYDHLAGKLGVQLTQALVDQRALAPTDGIPDTRRRSGDRLSSRLPGHPWMLGPAAAEVFAGLGVAPERLTARPSRRPLLRFCIDWSEQRHHLAGQLGADVLAALLDAGWMTRVQGQRSVQLTPPGRQALSSRLRLDV
jgi:DNA-binding transcriptional ArsR family regulator